MWYIQHYIKTVHFWLKYNGLAIVRKTTKLIEGGHRGLQDYRHMCYYFYVFTFFYIFLKTPKIRHFLRFLPCFVRFLELCSRVENADVSCGSIQYVRCKQKHIKNFKWCFFRAPIASRGIIKCQAEVQSCLVIDISCGIRQVGWTNVQSVHGAWLYETI